jgi:hypothetical protein
MGFVSKPKDSIICQFCFVSSLSIIFVDYLSVLCRFFLFLNDFPTWFQG